MPLLAMLLIGVLVAGCGSDADKAEDTASKAISGLGMGDEKQVCDQPTPAAERKLLTVLADNPLGFPDIKASSCEQAITTLHSKLPPEIKASLEEGEVDEAKVDGDKAVVHVEKSFRRSMATHLHAAAESLGPLAERLATFEDEECRALAQRVAGFVMAVRGGA